jgi:GTP-binding protein Era
MDAPAFRSGTVVIAGRANAGKSTLLNAILGETVSVASPVAQTTRRAVRGILNEPDLQIVFLDTPGIRQATHPLGALLNRTARGLVTGADAAVLVIDSSLPPQDEDLGWMNKLAREETPVYAALNKTDRACRRADYEAAWADTVARRRDRDPQYTPPPWRWFEISAATGAGLPELLSALRDAMPEGAPAFPTDQIADDPLPFFIADVIREQINTRLKAELPHAIAVATDSVQDQPDGTVRVAATIYVEKPTQRPIVIGNKGKMIRDIRHAAERELLSIYGTPHRLDLWVKVEPDWTRNYWLLKKFGYV